MNYMSKLEKLDETEKILERHIIKTSQKEIRKKKLNKHMSSKDIEL